jgi:hypothetical protein
VDIVDTEGLRKALLNFIEVIDADAAMLTDNNINRQIYLRGQRDMVQDIYNWVWGCHKDDIIKDVPNKEWN